MGIDALGTIQPRGLDRIWDLGDPTMNGNKIHSGKACGILIYECLSGESPFSANDQNAICRKIVQRSFKYPKTAMFTPDAKDIIDKLLQKKGSDRLASGPSGASAVKNHPFYKSIDWNGLMAKTEKAPWVPKVKNDLDVSNFDSYGVDDTFDKSWSDPAPGWDRDF